MNQLQDRDSMRILLIQMRKDPSMLGSEREGFVSLSGLAEDQFFTLDVFRTPIFAPQIIDPFDAVIIGGLSDDPSQSVELPPDQFPFINDLQDLIRYAIARRKPSLLSCGGFMIASLALGAPVVANPNLSELGVYPIELTGEARQDPLFRGFPKQFKAVSGHIKSTLSPPPGCTLLAFTGRCPVHAFKATDAPFYAFQFHPEIKCADLRARVERYKEKYCKSEEEYQEFVALMDDTTEANSIITRFVDLVSEWKGKNNQEKNFSGNVTK